MTTGDGGKLYCDIARRAARKLNSSGFLDSRGEDQDDYHTQLWCVGVRAEWQAKVKRKNEKHIVNSVKKAIYNRMRSIARDRNIEQKYLRKVPVDPDFLKWESNLDRVLDARKKIGFLQKELPEDDWPLIDVLQESEGRVLQAHRLHGEISKSEFLRRVASLRLRVKAVFNRNSC